jgi:hypothetical protein
VPVRDDPRYQPITETHSLFKGEDKTLRVPIVDRTTQAAKDITGWTLSWVLSDVQGGSNLVTKVATVTDGAGGICEVALEAGDTASRNPGTYFYSLTRTDTGAVAVVAFGSVVLQAR